MIPRRLPASAGAARHARAFAWSALFVVAAARAELSNETLLGAGVRSQPAYDGSASQYLQAVPVIRYFGHPWYARSTQDLIEAGARTELAEGLNLGAQAGYEPGRTPEQSGFMREHGIPGMDRGASLGGHLEWDHYFGPMPTSWLFRVRQHLGHNDSLLADFRVSAGLFQYGRFAGGIALDATWADAPAMNRLYGVSPAESLDTGLPADHPGAGWMYSSVGLGVRIDLVEHWIMGIGLESRNLLGAAARSPLVERTQNDYITTAVAYQF